ncbi:MAG TPA: 3-hydroxyacyl-CoA dehydrogenase NAD-binding domain-containing protein [Caulobacteraceae bacterium]|jgi:3-hydroxybutyryl-CoA dehydrogenase
MSRIEEVLVVGAGSVGREIALQCAMCGYRVTVCDISREVLHEARAVIEMHARTLSPAYVPEPAAAILGRIYYTLDLEEALATADIVSESAPEDVVVKRALFARMGALAPPHTIFTTNSSSLTPSMIADATGRPDQFLALHFHKTVWVSNLVDVMPHPGTRPETIEAVTAFARSIRQTPILMAKERPSYVFNAMLEAYNGAALLLWHQGFVGFEDIDRAWMIAQCMDHGPFGGMDMIGIDTLYDVVRIHADAGYVEAPAIAEHLKTEFLDRGLLGLKSGQGFYTYPNPSYRADSFLGIDPIVMPAARAAR